MGRLTIPDVVHEFDAYPLKDDSWGSLHIVLEDGNVDDESVFCCYKHAKKVGDKEGLRLACLLFNLTKTQRRKLPFKVGCHDSRRSVGTLRFAAQHC